MPLDTKENRSFHRGYYGKRHHGEHFFSALQTWVPGGRPVLEICILARGFRYYRHFQRLPRYLT
jgi:hypothetical protein